MEKESKSLILSLSFYLIYVFMPITRLLSSTLKAGFILFALFFFIYHLLHRPNRLLVNFILSSVGFVFVDFLIYYGVWRTNGAVVFFDKSLMLFVFWLPLLYAPSIMESNTKTKRRIYYVFLLFFIIEAITTCFGNIIFPMASRTLASNLDVIQNRVYQAANIGGYGFVYALSFSIPIFTYMYRFLNKKYLFLILFSLLTISVTSYMTAITLSILGLLVTFAVSNRRVFLVGCIIVGLFFIGKNYITDSLANIAEIAYSSENDIMGERISSIRDVLMNEEASGDLAYRDELRNSSIDAFWASPLLGNLTGEFRTLGLHSEFVDWLGGLGIIGFMCILLVIFPKIRRYIRYFSKTNIKTYVIISFIMCFVFGFLNVITTAPEISSVLFILPMVAMSRVTVVGKNIV